LPKARTQEPGQQDTDSDRFPSVGRALHKIAEEAGAVEGQPEHLEIHFMQSGEATWRMWIKGEEETRGNVLTDL
jgi:hypothetical protein